MVKVTGKNGLTVDVPASIVAGLVRSEAVDADSVDLSAVQAEAEGSGDSGFEAPAGDEGDKLYDPADYNVAQVEEHLATVDDEEYLRIIEAEKAGKNRSGIVSLLVEDDEADGE